MIVQLLPYVQFFPDMTSFSSQKWCLGGPQVFLTFFLRIPDAWKLTWKSSTDILATYGQVNASNFMCTCRPSVQLRWSKHSALDAFLLENPAEKEGKPINCSGWKHTSIYTKLENCRMKDWVPGNDLGLRLLPYHGALHQINWNYHLLQCCLYSPVQMLTQRCRV